VTQADSEQRPALSIGFRPPRIEAAPGQGAGSGRDDRDLVIHEDLRDRHAQTAPQGLSQVVLFLGVRGTGPEVGDLGDQMEIDGVVNVSDVDRWALHRANLRIAVELPDARGGSAPAGPSVVPIADPSPLGRPTDCSRADAQRSTTSFPSRAGCTGGSCALPSSRREHIWTTKVHSCESTDRRIGRFDAEVTMRGNESPRPG
jgi:hypothetical protein